MCYYNGQRVTRAEYILLMRMQQPVAKYDFLNVKLHDGFSYGNVAVLKPDAAKDNFDIVQMEWGFLPEYLRDREAVERFRKGYKDNKGMWHQGYTTLNAKAENLFINEEGTKKSMYADAARERRCLVLSTGFFEWRHIFPINKRTGQPVKTSVKYPHYITLKDQEYFYFAGVWQNWADKTTGEIVPTLAIVTAPANGLMTIIHNSKKRMPTILNDDLAYRWMMEDLTDDEITAIAMTQYPSMLMEACPIDKDFKTSDEPTTPFSYPEQDLPAYETAFDI